jgi:hypothetical protein
MRHVVKNNIVWFLLVLSIKLTTVLFLTSLTRCDHPESMYGLASYTGDADSYIKPYDNLIAEGKYYNGNLIAPRTPAVGAVYFVCRIFADKSSALTIQVVLQILMECAAIVLMARLAEKLTGRQAAFYLCIGILTLSTWTTFYSYQVLSESFSISLLCIAAFYYHNYISDHKKSMSLLWIAILLSILSFLKPYFGVLYILITADLFIHNRRMLKTDFTQSILRPLLILSVPLIVLIGSWTLRNYIESGKIIPFQEDVYAGLKLDPAGMAVRTFVESVGESSVFWDTKSAAHYFYNANAPEFKFSQRVYDSGIRAEDIETARQLFLKHNAATDPVTEDSVIRLLTAMTNRFIENDQLGFHVISRFKLAGLFLFHSGSFYLPITKSSECYAQWHMIIKFLESALYYVIVIAGFTGLLFYAKNNRIVIGFLLIVGFLIVLFPVILRSPEARYFVPAVPLLTVGAVLVFNDVQQRLVSKLKQKQSE